MSANINISDIVVTTKHCIWGKTVIPQGSYFVVETFGLPVSQNSKVFIHVKGTKKVFSTKEVKLAKTFALGDVVKFKSNRASKLLGYDDSATWLINAVSVESGILTYEIRPTKPSRTGNCEFQYVGPEDIVGFNVTINIQAGDRVIVIKNGGEHHKVFTVSRVKTENTKNQYELNNSYTYGEDDIRIWEDKDERIRNNFYKVSKLLRKNEEMLNEFRMADDALEMITTDREILQNAFNEFMDKRVFTKETIKRMNTIYKENIESFKSINIKLAEMEKQDVKTVV